MAFSSTGALSGAGSGAAAGGSIGGPWGAVAGGALGGVAGGLLGPKKPKPIDITQQLQQVQDEYNKNNQLNTGLTTALNPLTDQYKASLAAALSGAKTDLAGNTSQYLTNTNNNIKQAQDALRSNLYSGTFNALPGTLESIREASAAGGGLNTGSYQKAVSDVGRQTAQTIGEGEQALQAQGAQAKQGAQSQAFDAFNQLTSHLTDQQISGLTKVMDTGREDLVRQYTTSMGLNEDETNAVIGLLNFQQSQGSAADNAAASGATSTLSGLAGLAGTIYGSGKQKASPMIRPVGGQ